MILCDTNILIEFYKNNPQIVQVLRRIGEENLSISAVTQGELYFGAINKTELAWIRQHLALLARFPLSEEITYRFLQLMEEYSLSHKLSIPDALIAATALVHDLELYTLNIRDFRFIPSLRLYQAEGETRGERD